MYWTRLVLVRPAASLYSASPLKHHPTGKQWCPNPDHYSDSEPARWSLTLLCWAQSRAAELQILTSFVWCDRGSNHQPPACQASAQPLHYPAAVWLFRCWCAVKLWYHHISFRGSVMLVTISSTKKNLHYWGTCVAVGLKKTEGYGPYTCCSRWYDHEWLKADYKPDSPTHILVKPRRPAWMCRMCLPIDSSTYHDRLWSLWFSYTFNNRLIREQSILTACWLWLEGICD